MAGRAPGWRRCALAAASGAIATALLAPGCEIAAIPENTCGNRVVEPSVGEACDHFVDNPALRCGEPGTKGACQFVCDGERDYRCDGCCPAGHQCGHDGLCRRPTGTFQPAAAPLAAGAEELVVGDLDGDEQLDVVRMLDEDLSVVFGATRTAAPVVHESQFDPLFLPVPVKRSAASIVDSGLGGGDAGVGTVVRSDLVVPRLGIATYRVSSEQSLLPTSLPAFRVPGDLGELAMIAFRLAGDPYSGTLIWHVAWQSVPVLVGVRMPDENAPTPDENPHLEVIAYPRGLPSELSRPAVVASIDVRPESPCEDILFGFRGQAQIELYNPCRPDEELPNKFVLNTCRNPFDCPDDLPRRIDVGGPLARGPFVVDLNGDGYLDLVAQVEASDTSDCAGHNEICYETRSALGVGNGSFHSDPSSFPPVDGEGDNRLAPDGTLALEGDPIVGLGDLDRRGIVDVVTDRVVRVNFVTPDGTPYGYDVALNPGERWDEALVADFDSNDVPDVAATSHQGERLFFYLGEGEGMLNPFTVALSAPLAQLQIGDYDGDLVPDLLGVGLRPAVVGSEGPVLNEVTVLWGSPVGPPERPEVLGRTAQQLTVSSGTLSSEVLFSVGKMSDGVDDVIAVGRAGTDLDSVHVFFGRGDREVRSALGLVAGSFDDILSADFQPHLARKVVAGHFVASSGAEELAVVTSEPFKDSATGYNYHLWLVPELDNDFRPHDAVHAVEPIDQRDTAAAAVWELGLYEAIDIDRDGDDELVALAPRWSDPARSSYRIGLAEQDGEGVVS